MTEKKRIYLCLAKMSESGAEQHFIKEAFASNWVAPLGPNVDAFEKDLEDFVNAKLIKDPLPQNINLQPFKRVAVMSSCTASIHVALLLLGVRKEDEVICQSFSFCASSNPVTYCGARPVFVESDKETWNMSPELLEEAIKDRVVRPAASPRPLSWLICLVCLPTGKPLTK